MRTTQEEPFNPAELGAFGNAENMLVRKFQFPDTYDAETEKVIGWYSDRIRQNNWDLAKEISAKYGVGQMHVEGWAAHHDDATIMNFLKEILEADQHITWTGYRILVSIHRANGYSIYYYELFAKDESSGTEVQTYNPAMFMTV